MTHRSASLLCLCLASCLAMAACRSSERAPAPEAKPAPAPVLPKLERAAAIDLARELDEAARRGTWFEVRKRWQGQTLRWTVTRQRALCRTAASCNVVAFPVSGGAPAGWLPGLSFAPGQFAALEARCADREQCEITVEGVLEKLTASDEQPTNLVLTDVKLVDIRT